MRSFSSRAVRRTDFMSKLADSRTMRRVSSVTSLSTPPITPASPTARSASAMTSISGSSWPLLMIERFQRLAGPRAPHDDAPVRQAVGVEGVQRLAVFEHDVVRDIDDRVDRPHPGREQPPLHPGRRRSDH